MRVTLFTIKIDQVTYSLLPVLFYLGFVWNTIPFQIKIYFFILIFVFFWKFFCLFWKFNKNFQFKLKIFNSNSFTKRTLIFPSSLSFGFCFFCCCRRHQGWPPFLSQYYYFCLRFSLFTSIVAHSFFFFFNTRILWVQTINLNIESSVKLLLGYVCNHWHDWIRNMFFFFSFELKHVSQYIVMPQILINHKLLPWC